MTKKVMRVWQTDDSRNVTLVCEICEWNRDVKFHFNKNKNVRILDVGTSGWECFNPKNKEKCEIAENQKRENYCIETGLDCKKCSLSFDGRDCIDNSI